MVGRGGERALKPCEQPLASSLRMLPMLRAVTRRYTHETRRLRAGSRTRQHRGPPRASAQRSRGQLCPVRGVPIGFLLLKQSVLVQNLSPAAGSGAGPPRTKLWTHEERPLCQDRPAGPATEATAGDAVRGAAGGAAAVDSRRE